MSSSILRGLNNTTIPLGANGVFTGGFEFTGAFLTIVSSCLASTSTSVVINQSLDGQTIKTSQTFTLVANVFQSIQENLSYPYTQLVITNLTSTPQTELSVYTIYTNVLPTNANVIISNTSPILTEVSNLITETLATTPVSILIVGQFYRVATIGLTTGAEWAVVGAIVGGESEPSIGRLFKALAVAPNIGGQGTCYSVEYTDTVSSTITNFPATQVVSGTVSLTNPTTVRVADFYGDPILTTAGNLMVGINNIYTANPLHTIVDSGSLTATPPSSSSISFVSASTTGQTIKASAGVLKGLYISSDGVIDVAYVKLYNVAVPTSADIPVLVIAVLFGSSQTIDTFSLGFSTAIGVRATDGSANNDNVVPTNNINVSAFFI